MISKVPMPTIQGSENKSIFLGVNGREADLSIITRYFVLLAAFFSSSFRMGIPGFTPFKISQDFAHLRAPRPFSHFHP